MSQYPDIINFKLKRLVSLVKHLVRYSIVIDYQIDN